jgi:hypothetical protein
LLEQKAPDYEQSERVFHKKDVKAKRDPSSAAVQPGAVSVLSPGATATATATAATSTARKPGSGIVPQTNQLREPSEVARAHPAGMKNPAVKNDPNLILPLDDSQIKSEEKAYKSKESGFG